MPEVYSDTVAQTLRQALRRVACTVTVVTARTGDGLRGAMTATSTTSLSLDPPTMLVCVNRNSAFHEILERADSFCINVLNHNQTEMAVDCGGRVQGEEKLDGEIWQQDVRGAPYLRDATAVIQCRKTNTFIHGTHSIILGEVVSVDLRGEPGPLIYLDGGFRRV